MQKITAYKTKSLVGNYAIPIDAVTLYLLETELFDVYSENELSTEIQNYWFLFGSHKVQERIVALHSIYDGSDSAYKEFQTLNPKYKKPKCQYGLMEVANQGLRYYNEEGNTVIATLEEMLAMILPENIVVDVAANKWLLQLVKDKEKVFV